MFLVAVLFGALLATITADPADAQTCDPSLSAPWANQQALLDTCVRNPIAHPTYGDLLDPNSTAGPNGLLTAARVAYYGVKDFTENFLWYAPRTTMTVGASDSRHWTACNVNIAPGGTCDPFDIQSGLISNAFTGQVELNIIGDETHFIALACGNHSIDVGPPPIPIPEIGVFKFQDTNRNGSHDPGEPPMAGVEFRAGRQSSLVGQPNEAFPDMTTGPDGRITIPLNGHGPGTYYFEEIVPAGFDLTTSPVRHTVEVPFGAESDVYQGAGAEIYEVEPFGNMYQLPDVNVGDHQLYEGETILIDSAVVTNNSGLELTYNWSPATKLNDGALLEPSFTGLDDAVDNLTLTVTDPFGQSASDVGQVTTLNLPPVPEVGEDVVLDENDLFVRTGLTYTDAGVLDTHVGTVDYGDGSGPQPLTLTPTGPGAGTFDLEHRYLDDDPTATPQDDYTVTVTITDDDGGVGQDTLTVTVRNLDPTTEAGGDAIIDEGDTFVRDLTFADIGTLDTHEVLVDFGEGDGFESVPFDPGTNTFRLEHLYADDDPTATPQDDYTVTVRVEDDDLGSVEDSFTITVNDIAPDLEITSPSFDGELFAAPATVNLVAPFTDPGVRDTFECRIDWDEGPATLDPPEPDTVFDAPFSGTDGNCNATNVFEQAGVYTIRVTVTDDDTLFDVEERMIVVYDPSAGFVTGGGHIDSPAGAYIADPTLTGRATFGFVSKYLKRSNVPEGNTEFQFHAAGMNFHSGDYDWLVVTANGTRAQYKGTGTINGDGDYGFMMTVYDNGEPGSGVDQLRLKIWDRATDALVYDNRLGESDDVDRADPQIITNGNIQIHTKGGPRG